MHEPSTRGAAPAWRLSPEDSRLAAALLATLAACTLDFSKLAEDVASELACIHCTVVVWLHAHQPGFTTALLTTVTRLGGADLLLAVTLLAALALALRRRVAHAALMGASAHGECSCWY
jgi:hypothetical protein